MRRLLVIALFAALPAAAQIHGVPASVTSITPSRSNPGVPASVTSLGPKGYADPMFRPAVDPMFRRPPVDPMFRNPAYGNRCCDTRRSGRGRHRGGGHHRRAVAPYVPYYYYPYYPAYSEASAEPAPAADAEPEEEEPPALTIYERRPRIAYSTGASDEDRYGEHYTDYREEERRRAKADEERQAEEQRQEEQRAQEERRRSEQPEEPAAVLVFKDGHRQDVVGYAITGDVLYDLGQGRARKIQLADLDLPATLKLNDELGNDFRLPTRPPK